MLTKGIVLSPRRYRTSVQPPAVLEDESRFGNNGAFVNTPTWTQLPSGLWYLTFVLADSDEVNCGNNVSLDSLTYTLMGWLNSPDISVADDIFYKAAPPRYLRMGTAASKFIIVADSALGQTFRYSSVYLSNTWYFVTGTYDPSVVSAPNIYINGILDNGVSVGLQTTVGSVINTGNLVFGHDNGGNMNFRLALPRVYNYILTPAKIYSIFQAERRFFNV